MTDTAIAPAAVFEPLVSDFFGFAAELTDIEKEALAKLRAYLETEVKPLVTEHWEKATFPHEIIPGLHAQGIAAFGWDETKPFPNSAVFRGFVALELARVDASIATYVGVQNGLAAGAISLCGDADQRSEWLPKLASGEVIGSFGLTEPLSGSDSAQGLRTTARHEDGPSGGRWVLNGSKRWIGNATFGDITVIWAKDVADDQVKGFIVPNDTPGFVATKIENKVSLRIVQNADITLTDVVVPDSNKLANANSFRDTARVLRHTRAEVAWEAVGIAIGAYEAALAYAKERVQFGKPLAKHQLIQDQLVKSLGNITASLALVVQVSKMLDNETQRDEHSALAKAFATSKMRETVAWCREVLGGNGIVLDHDAARFFADSEAIYSYEGTREMNTLIVGRAITGQAAFV